MLSLLKPTTAAENNLKTPPSSPHTHHFLTSPILLILCLCMIKLVIFLLRCILDGSPKKLKQEIWWQVQSLVKAIQGVS